MSPPPKDEPVIRGVTSRGDGSPRLCRFDDAAARDEAPSPLVSGDAVRVDGHPQNAFDAAVVGGAECGGGGGGGVRVPYKGFGKSHDETLPRDSPRLLLGSATRACGARCLAPHDALA